MFFITLILRKNKITNHPYWHLSTILVRPSTDGVERAVKIKTDNRGYIRPATKLCLLEQS